MCPDLLLPVEDSNNDEDEDAHSNQCDGRQQDTIAGSQVQFRAPAEEGGRWRRLGILIVHIWQRKRAGITK